MKVLIDEANRMLQSLQQSDPKEKTIAPKLQDDKMAQLQRQLDELKKASLRPFRLSRMACTKATACWIAVQHTLFELDAKEKELVIFQRSKSLLQVINK